MPIIVLLVLFSLLSPAESSAADAWVNGHPAAPDRILLEPNEDALGETVSHISASPFSLLRVSLIDGRRIDGAELRLRSSFSARARFLEVSVPKSMSLAEALKTAAKIPGIRSAWPNYRSRLFDFTPFAYVLINMELALDYLHDETRPLT